MYVGISVPAILSCVYMCVFCRGTLFHHCADCLQPELQQVLPLYIDRLNNEVTRIAAAKAITIIAE